MFATASNFLRGVRARIGKRAKGSTNWSAISFCLFCVVVGGIGASRLPRENVVTEHNVAILARLDNGDFAYKSDEKPMGDTYRPCDIDKKNHIDVDGMLTQAAEHQYIAERATWQETGTCRSLLRPEWQFWFRDMQNNFTYRRLK